MFKVENKYIVGDNLDILKSIDSKYDFCYIDPPYNTGRDFGDFGDSFKDMNGFIEFMKPRLQLIHDRLKDTGNLIVHVDSIASHYVKVCLDSIFGIKNFKNELIVTTSNMKAVKKKLMRSHDVLLVYSKNINKSVYYQQYTPYPDNGTKGKVDERGEYGTSAAKNSQPNVIVRPNLRYEWNGHNFQWWISKEKMQTLHNENRLEYNKEGIPRIKRYYKEMKGIPFKDVWTDISSIQSNEKLDYATQKPVKLLNRLLDLFTTEGDLCLDIFAGSGTLGRSCLDKNRDFTLIDINPKGKEVFYKHLSNTVYKFTK